METGIEILDDSRESSSDAAKSEVESLFEPAAKMIKLENEPLELKDKSHSNVKPTELNVAFGDHHQILFKTVSSELQSSNAMQSSALFKGIRFYPIDIPETVVSLLVNHGASQENSLSVLCTHVIAGLFHVLCN